MLLLCYKRTPRAASADLGMRCPISLTPVADLKYPACIRNSAQHAVYELRELCQWYRVAGTVGTDLLARKRITWKHIISAGQPRKKFNNLSCTKCRLLWSSNGLESNLWWIILRSIEQTLTTLRDTFASSLRLTGPCDAIWMRVGMFLAGIIASTEPPLLVLKEQQQGGIIATTNWNKTEMIRAYTHALVTYQRVCDVLGRPKSPGYTSDVQVGNAGLVDKFLISL